MDWLDLLAVQGTLKSLLQHHSSKASILRLLPYLEPVCPKGDQSWVFIGRNDVKAEAPIIWLPDTKSWLIGKDPAAGRGWGQEEKETTEDEMAGWHQQLYAHEFEWTPGVVDRQGGLACCNSWGRKEPDMTEQQNWTDWISISIWE